MPTTPVYLKSMRSTLLSGIIISRVPEKYTYYFLQGGFPEYTVGDVNFDGVLDVLDLNYIVDMILGFGYESTPPADVNTDGNVDINDTISLYQSILNY